MLENDQHTLIPTANRIRSQPHAVCHELPQAYETREILKKIERGGSQPRLTASPHRCQENTGEQRHHLFKRVME